MTSRAKGNWGYCVLGWVFFGCLVECDRKWTSIKDFPDIKMFTGDLCREESLVSNTAFMPGCAGCLWLQNSDPCNYFWDLHLPQISLQWTVQKLLKGFGGCGRNTNAFRKAHCHLMITGEQGWKSAWHSAFPTVLTVLSASFLTYFPFRLRNSVNMIM